MSAPTEAQVRQLFDHFDKDKSGYITIEEAKTGSEQLGMSFTEADIKDFLSGDSDKDGKISFKEFYDGICKAM